MDQNNNKIELKVKCKICQKSLFEELLKKHMRISHPDSKLPVKNIFRKKLKQLEDGRVKCLECKKSCSNLQWAKTHYMNVRVSTILEFMGKPPNVFPS